MVYRKKKSNGYKRPGYYNCGKMVVSDARKALKMAGHLKRLVNVEIKNFDILQTSVSLSATPIIIQLSNIPQGDTTVTRDGAQCKVLSIELSILLVRSSAANVTAVRLMLVCDKQTNQAIYLNSDLLANVTLSDNIVAPLNLNNKFRFNVIWDRTFSLNNASTTKVIKNVFSMSKILRFDASTSMIADLTSNSFSLVQVTNETTNFPAITMFSRIRFVDN